MNPVLLLLAAGCHVFEHVEIRCASDEPCARGPGTSSTETDADTDTDTDTDTDADTDTDTDTDTDADTDTDTDVDVDTGPFDVDGDGVTAASDCDDTNAAVYPGAPETCDGVDEDCDGIIDNAAVDVTTAYADATGTGSGTPRCPRRAAPSPPATSPTIRTATTARRHSTPTIVMGTARSRGADGSRSTPAISTRAPPTVTMYPCVGETTRMVRRPPPRPRWFRSAAGTTFRAASTARAA